MSVEADHEEEREVVGVPESLKALLADLVMGGAVHDDHEEKHDMTGDATWLPIVDIEGISRSEFCIEEKLVRGDGECEIRERYLRKCSTLIKLT